MLRLSLLALAVLLATSAHAQTMTDEQRAIIESSRSLAETMIGLSDNVTSNGGTVLLETMSAYSPAVVERAGAPQFVADLEAGVDYGVIVFCADESLDPDVIVSGPDGEEIVVGDAVSADAVAFTASESGTHTIQVEMFGCESDACDFGYVLFQQ